MRRRQRNPWVRRIKRFAVFSGITVGLVVSAGLAVYIPIYQEAADDAANIENRLIVKNQRPTQIWSSDGKQMWSYTVERREVVDLNKLPKHVRYALVAAEDKRFYDHQGIDPIGMARVAFTAARNQKIVSGGSTISMQLAKLMVNGDARTAMRKLKDMATAQQIEAMKSKDEILNLYANYVYYGEHAFGIQRAAQVYFGKSAKDLTLGEAAMLARAVRLPSRVNPIRSPEKMIGLRNYVLGVMLEEGWITQGEYDGAIREVPKIMKRSSLNSVPATPVTGYFVDHVRAQLKEDFPGVDFEAGGYKIETTLNYQLQKRAIEAVAEILRQNKGRNVNDGAIVVMDQYGRILAEVGGADYNKRKFNVVTTGKRQPGSAFKAFVYATALRDGGIQPNSSLSNAPIHEDDQGRPWNPGNASRRENARSYSLYTAFAASVNLPAIHTIMEKTSPANVVAACKDVFGFKSRLGPYPSLALGTSEVKPLEMLEAYSVFMLGGDRVEPQCIARVIDPDGNVLRDYRPIVHEQVLSPEVAQQMDNLLRGPVGPGGTATAAQAVPNARGKTGTTNDAKDAWFCGYADGLVAVGWVGNSGPKGEALKMHDRVFGGTVTVNIWTAVMQSAHRLGLAKGVKGAPSATISVKASPYERYSPPPREDKVVIAPPDPVVIDPKPDPYETTPETYPEEVPPIDTPPADDPPTGDGSGAEPPTVPIEATPTARDRRRERERAREREKPKPEAPQEVDVVICVDTGMRASAYCNETVTRRFPRGRAPRVKCTTHHG